MNEQVPSKEQSIGCYVMEGVTYTSHEDGSETSRKATAEEVLLADALQRVSDELRGCSRELAIERRARSLADRHPNSNGTDAGSNPAGRSIQERIGFEVDGVEAYRLAGGALEISEPVEDGYILIPATVTDAFCKWAGSLYSGHEPSPEPGIITAQHGETGRMWQGPRSCTPDGYHEVPSLSGHAAWQRERMAKWISKNKPALPDHACAQCVPGGDIVVEDFECVYHMALKIAGPTPTKESAP